MFCVMSFKAFIICCCFTTTIFGHLVPAGSTRKHFQPIFTNNNFSNLFKFILIFYSEKSNCKALDTEITYPFARRDESIVDDLHGTKVNIPLQSIYFCQSKPQLQLLLLIR